MHTIAFGRYLLDTKRRVLLADGQPVKLQSKPIELLEFLIANRDRIVGRDEILGQVWRGQTVAPGSVTVQINALRSALAATGGTELILTVPGRGYRFLGEVKPKTETGSKPVTALVTSATPAPPPLIETNPQPARRRARFLAPLALLTLGLTMAALYFFFHPPAALPPRLSIAVLPFRDLSDDHAHNAMADAISDDLTTDLAHIPGSVVIARESADSFRGRAVPTVAIGRALNVRYLLEGSLRGEGSTLHINAQLIDAATGAHLWAERFETPLTKLGEARTTIVRRIASALDIELTEIEGARGANDRPSDPDALSLFYRARSLVDHDDTLAGLQDAQDKLELAVKKQPGFADAHALLGLTLLHKVLGTDDPTNEKDIAEARSVVAQALALAPRNPTALAADARLHLTEGQCAAAIYSANAALAEEPNSIDALSVLAKCAVAAGKLDDAALYEQDLLQLNPASSMNKSRFALLAQVRLLQGRTAEALALTQQALSGEKAPAPGADSMGRVEYCKLLQIAAYQISGDTVRAAELYALYKRVWLHRTVWRIGSYATSGVARLPGYASFLVALRNAGMPQFANESVDEHVQPTTSPHLGGDFDPTPLTIPGGKAISTATLEIMLESRKPIVIDLGRGAAVIPGAVWEDVSVTQDDDNAYIDQILNAHDRAQDAELVIVGAGTYGFDSYNGALHAISLGYRHVFWYRGGEEAWAAAHLVAEDRRHP